MPQPPSTLADTLEALARVPGLSARTVSDLQSAIRCLCRVAGLDPAVTVAGDLASLQARLVVAHPERHGLSPARWAVIRSQVQRALSLTGAAAPLKTASTRLSPEWEALLTAIPLVRHRFALSRFARFCCQQGVAPSEVSQDVFDRYHVALTTQSLIRKAEVVYRDTARAWARQPEGIAGVIPATVAVPALPSNRKAGRHPLGAFPASFRDELAAFSRWAVTPDPLHDQSRAKALREQTVISYRNSLHTAADAAVRAGVPIAGITAISVLATPEVFVKILRQLLADRDQKATPTVHGAAIVLVILAHDWLKLPPETLTELKRIKGKLPKLRPGLTQKNRELLAAFDDQTLLRRFLLLADELWREVLDGSLPRNQRLVRAQLALLIGILQITPLRRRNACVLVFDRHLTWPNGPKAPAMVQFPAAEMKTEIDYVGELPLELSRRLHHYRTKLAPELTGTVPKQLFVKIDGRAKSEDGVTNRLVFYLNKRLGLKMSLHQFRHVAAKLMLDANPGAYETVAQNLGHTGTKNVVKFYGGVDTHRASRHHAKLIEKLRDEARQQAPKRRRKP